MTSARKGASVGGAGLLKFPGATDSPGAVTTDFCDCDPGARKVDMSRAPLVCFAYAQVGKGAWKLDF